MYTYTIRTSIIYTRTEINHYSNMLSSQHGLVSGNKKNQVSLDRLCQYVLIGGLFVSALTIVPFTTLPFFQTKGFLIALTISLAIIIFVVARLSKGSAIIPPLFLIALAWLIPCTTFISAFFSPTPLADAFFGSVFEPSSLGTIVMLTLASTLGALVFRNAKHFSFFLSSLGVLIFIVGVSQIIFVILSLVTNNQIQATSSLIGSFLDAGIVAGLGTILALFSLRFIEVSGFKKYFIIALLIVSLLVLILSNQIAFWVPVILASFGFFIEGIMKRKSPQIIDDELDGVAIITDATIPQSQTIESRTSSFFLTPVIVLCLGVFFTIGGTTIGSALTSALNTQILDVRPSVQGTLDIAIPTLAGSPLFGSGPGSFGEQWMMYKDAQINQTLFWGITFTSGFGFIPTQFATLGFLGISAWIIFLVAFVAIGIRRTLFQLPADAHIRFIQISLFVGTAYMFTISFVQNIGIVPLLIAFLMLGVFVSSLRFGKEREEWGIVFARSPRIGFAIAFSLTLVLLSSVYGVYAYAERYIAGALLSNSIATAQAGNLDVGRELATQSANISQTDEAFRFIAEIEVAKINRLVTNTDLSPDEAQAQLQNAVASGVEAGQRAVELDQNNHLNWLVLGQVYQVLIPLQIEGAYENAKASFERAQALAPKDPSIMLTRANVEASQGNISLAREFVSQAIALKTDYVAAIFLLSQIESATGNAQGALDAAEAAAFFAPNDASAWFQVGLLRYGLQDRDGATAAFTRAIELNPEFVNARLLLAITLSLSGRTQDAIVQLENISSTSSENAAAVADDLAQLRQGNNPFTQSRLSDLNLLPTETIE